MSSPAPSQSPRSRRARRIGRAATVGALAAAAAGAAVVPALAQPASGPVVRSATGASPADIKDAVEQFRVDLGGGTVAGPNGSFGGRRREINWDGVPDNLSAPNDLPADFFNTRSPRGVVFETPGVAFQVSAKAGLPTPPRLGNISPKYVSGFGAFSEERIFTAVASTETVVKFFVPGTNKPALVRGFGSVFTDVDHRDSSWIELYGADNKLITKLKCRRRRATRRRASSARRCPGRPASPGSRSAPAARCSPTPPPTGPMPLATRWRWTTSSTPSPRPERGRERGHGRRSSGPRWPAADRGRASPSTRRWWYSASSSLRRCWLAARRWAAGSKLLRRRASSSSSAMLASTSAVIPLPSSNCSLMRHVMSSGSRSAQAARSTHFSMRRTGSPGSPSPGSPGGSFSSGGTRRARSTKSVSRNGTRASTPWRIVMRSARWRLMWCSVPMERHSSWCSAIGSVKACW